MPHETVGLLIPLLDLVPVPHSDYVVVIYLSRSQLLSNLSIYGGLGSAVALH